MDIIIAVDTGNWAVKSASQKMNTSVSTPQVGIPFTPGLTRHGQKVPPLSTGALTFEGLHYSISSSQRLPIRRDKTHDEDYRLLTLGAIAMEIRNAFPQQDSYGSKDAPVTVALALGLPVAHLSLSAQDGELLRSKYKDFFGFSGKILDFTFEDKNYTIRIEDVGVFPQSVAAVVAYPNIYSSLRRSLRSYIVDIGGGTTNIIPIINGKPQNPGMTIEEGGSLELYRQCMRRTLEEHGVQLDEMMCDGILRGVQTAPVRMFDTLNSCAEDFVRQLIYKMRGNGIDLTMSGLCFVGGTSLLLQQYIENEIGRDDISFIDDVSANAKGYLMLERGRLNTLNAGK